MDRQELIDMLNKDLADEHASVIRYLTHAYQVGEDTPFGSMLLTTAREEMWHMDWLGDEIGELGAEPLMKQGVYPYDPTSNASMLRSYIEWEENLIHMYARQAAQVNDPGLARMLQQEGLESVTHRNRFQEWLDKLGPEGKEPFHYGEEGGFSPSMIDTLHREKDHQYRLILQHLRHAFVFEDECPVSSELELTAMRHMKHLSHFAEELAESGKELQFDYPGIDTSRDLPDALAADKELTEAARRRFADLGENPELDEHQALKNEVQNMITRNEFLVERVEGLIRGIEPAPEADENDDASGFTVGSLIKR